VKVNQAKGKENVLKFKTMKFLIKNKTVYSIAVLFIFTVTVFFISINGKLMKK
jgi:hypothetical protein